MAELLDLAQSPPVRQIVPRTFNGSAPFMGWQGPQEPLNDLKKSIRAAAGSDRRSPGVALPPRIPRFDSVARVVFDPQDSASPPGPGGIGIAAKPTKWVKPGSLSVCASPFPLRLLRFSCPFENSQK